MVLFDPDIGLYSADANTWSSYPASKRVAAHSLMSLELYHELMRAGISREEARYVLPTNTYTKYYGTVSLHNLFGFLKLRDAKEAQKEIQLVAGAMRKIAEELFPVSMEAFGKYNG